MTRILFVSAALTLLSGCVSTASYVPPQAYEPVINSVEIDTPRSDAWKKAVPALARQFFVINTIDQSSGLINISYSGDPEMYVDCGIATVETPGGEPFRFPYAASQSFAFMLIDPYHVTRKVTLDGRVNLVFEEVAATRTRVTASTRYVLTRVMDAFSPGKRPINLSGTVSFNTNQSGSFGSSQDGQNVICSPTGKLERQLLDLLK